MKNILIVVDVQNGFTRYEQTKEVAKKIVELTHSGAFDYIIATQFINKEGSQFTEFLDWHRLQNSPDIDIYTGLQYDDLVKKYIYTMVDNHFMKQLSIINDGELPKEVYICGIDTDCCVLKVATDLFEHHIKPLVLLDYCQSNGGMKSHEAGILAMTRLIGHKSLLYGNIKNKSDLDKLID